MESVSRVLGLGEEVESKVLSAAGEMGSISRVLGEVDDEVVGDVAAEAAKEEGWELAKSNILGELEEELVVEVKLRSVLRGFLLLLLLLLILVGKGQVVGGEVMEGPSESIHLNFRS